MVSTPDRRHNNGELLSPASSEPTTPSIWQHKSCSSSVPAAPIIDEKPFLSMTPSPDKDKTKRMSKADHSPDGHEDDIFDIAYSAWRSLTRSSSDEEYHRNCILRARKLDLSDVRSMNVIWKVDDTDCLGRPSLVIIGAHYCTEKMSEEEKIKMILLAVKSMEDVLFSFRGYNVVYMHTGVRLPSLPNVTFIRDLHAALGVDHRTQLHRLYILHPTVLLKTHMLLYQTVEECYKKVHYCDCLEELYLYVSKECLSRILPGFVLEYDNALSPKSKASIGLGRTMPVAADAEDDAIDVYNENSIGQLVSMGFTRLAAIEALVKCGGDVKVAAVKLIQKSTPSPIQTPDLHCILQSDSSV